MILNGTAKIISNLPMEHKISKDEVNKLCRQGELYGYKLRKENFQPWLIPVDSFALYLSYHSLIATDFLTMNDEDLKQCEPDVLQFINKTLPWLSEVYREETYTIKQLSDIFHESVSETYNRFHPKSISHIFYPDCLKAKDLIYATQVIKYLSANPIELTYLTHKHHELLDQGNFQEAEKIRHFLMLQSYYKVYGYFK